MRNKCLLGLGLVFVISLTSMVAFAFSFNQNGKRRDISTFRRQKPGVQPYGQFLPSQQLRDKWLPSFSQNVDCFF